MEDNKNKTKCICIECGKEYYIFNSYIKRDGKRLYCSMNCRNKNLKEERNPRYKFNEGWLNCIYCGKEFKVKPSSILSKKNRTYCTKECKEKNNNSHFKIIKNCIECGNEFEVYKKHSERRKFCSRSCSSINFYRINNQINKGKQMGLGGKREDLNNKYFRSSWEANYARYLNYLKLNGEIEKWEYEVDTFEFVKIKKGTRFYTPDFKVYVNGEIEYHEVKGYMDDKSTTRHKRMKKYYPNIIIKIIDKEWFRLNGSNLRKVIINWEYKNKTRLY